MGLEGKRKLCILGIVIGVYLGFRYLVPVMIPFLVGWLLAAAVCPVGEWAQQRFHLKKNWVGTFLLLVLLAVCCWAVWMCGMLLWDQVRLAVRNFQGIAGWTQSALDQCCQAAEQIIGIREETSRRFLTAQISRIQEEMTGMITPENLMKIFSQAGKIFMMGTGALISWLSAILFLQEMDAIKKKVRESSVLRGARRIGKRLKETTVTYLKAQLVIMGAVGLICTLGFWLMKSPYYLLFGAGLGFLDALPVIGTGTFLYPAAVYFLFQKEFSLAAGCVFLDIITSVTREFLEPKLIGRKLGISPVIVLAAVYLGFYLYGPWGFLAGPMSLSVAYEIGKEWDIWD